MSLSRTVQLCGDFSVRQAVCATARDKNDRVLSENSIDPTSLENPGRVGNKGAADKVVAQLVGHLNVDTTLRVYTQVLDGSLRAAVDNVGSEFFAIVH